MNKIIVFSIGLLSGLAICGLFNFGVNTSMDTAQIQAYNSLNSRVNNLESRIAYFSSELQTEKGNREYSLTNLYSRLNECEDKVDSAPYKYVSWEELSKYIQRIIDIYNSKE
jgi:hypothetical protein